MEKSSVIQLLENLKNPDEEIRASATDQLWRRWFEQKGEFGLELLRRSQILLEAGKIDRAEELLSTTIRNQPDFAEAWNRLAVLYYVQGEYEKSRDKCLQVVQLNPIHFGAWHGLGLCQAALGNYRYAIEAFEKALEILPYSLENKKLILECNLRLS